MQTDALLPAGGGVPRYQTHAELHPASILSASAATFPLLHHNKGTYAVFALAQFKQGVGVYATNFANRMDVLASTLTHPQLPLVTTQFAKWVWPTGAGGENLVVAVMTYTGYNQEDAVVLNQDSVMRGMFRLTHVHTHRWVESRHGAEEKVLFRHPAVLAASGAHLEGLRGPGSYDKLAPDGLPREGAALAEGDVLLGRVAEAAADVAGGPIGPQQGVQGLRRAGPQPLRFEDRSEVAGRAEAQAVVDRVFVYDDPETGARAVKVRLRQTRPPELGDKVASRHGQKGTVGSLLPASAMPFCGETGLVPDLIINPHGFPKRMTVAHLLEALLAKAGAAAGARYAANPFEPNDTLLAAASALLNHGLDPAGDHVLHSGRTGEQLACRVFVGVNYYGRLKHMVADKLNWRATGPHSAITHQPTKGRNAHGGMRIGEMEQQALLTHGVASFIKESFMERADGTRILVDVHTGLPAFGLGTHGSPRASVEPGCPTAGYGLLGVPFAFNLLRQELQAIGVDTRLALDEQGAYGHAEDPEDPEDPEDLSDRGAGPPEDLSDRGAGPPEDPEDADGESGDAESEAEGRRSYSAPAGTPIAIVKLAEALLDMKDQGG